MRIILSTAIVSLYGFASFAQQVTIVPLPSIQTSENHLVTTPYVPAPQPNRAAAYIAQPPVKYEPVVIANDVGAKPSGKIDIMWMNNF